MNWFNKYTEIPSRLVCTQLDCFHDIFLNDIEYFQFSTLWSVQDEGDWERRKFLQLRFLNVFTVNDHLPILQFAPTSPSEKLLIL